MQLFFKAISSSYVLKGLLFGLTLYILSTKRELIRVQHFELKDNILYSNVEIDKQPYLFQIDFLQDRSILFIDSPIENHPILSKKNHGSRKLQTTSDSSSVHSSTFYLKYRMDISSTCSDSIKALQGILAHGYFAAESYELNFDKGVLLINGLAPDESEYKEIQAEFKDGQMLITMSINRKEYDLIFDMQYKGTLEMPLERFSYKEAPVVYEILTEEDVVLTEQQHKCKGLYFNGIYYSTTIITRADCRKARIGIGFMKGFNWIIDRKHKKVYVKKNTRPIDQLSEVPERMAVVKGGQIIISRKLISDHTIEINKKIVSINGAPVVANDICKLKALLEQNSNWSSLEIVVDSR
ncbi:MAG TPA: hypothetical protein VF581_10915 [Flavobacterium sp.]|jgi:hypothetical protein